MAMEFDNNLPIYLQIMQYIKKQIVTGTLKAGDKIPSVRELAAELQINPNTVQRTFQELGGKKWSKRDGDGQICHK